MLKWHQGKDGYLFLDNDSNQVWLQISGQWGAGHPGFSSQWISRHVSRAAVCDAIGIDYRHILVPNKETSLLWLADYPYSDGIITESCAPMNKIMSEPFPYKERVFFAPKLLENRSDFYVTDSHWNHTGALKYLKFALKYFNQNFLADQLEAHLIGWETISFQGDLGFHAGLPPELDQKPIYEHQAKLLFENNVINEGYVRHYKCENAIINRRVLIMHDSTIHRLYDTLAGLFKETFFIHCPDLDPAFASKFRAEQVLFFQMERFAVRLGSNEASFEEFVNRKEMEKTGAPLFKAYMDSLL